MPPSSLGRTLSLNLIPVNQENLWGHEPAMSDLYSDIVFRRMSHISVLVETLFCCCQSALSTILFNSLRISPYGITGGFFNPF